MVEHNSLDWNSTDSIRSTVTYLLSKRNNTSIKFDIIGHLPQELVQKILFDLSAQDLHSATFHCLIWKAAVVNNDYFWKGLCQRDGYAEVEEWQRSEFYNNFLEKYNYWQGVYWYNYTLQKNWRTHNCKKVTYVLTDRTKTSLNWRCYDDLIAAVDKPSMKLYCIDFKDQKLNETAIPTTLRDENRSGWLSRSGKYWIYFIPERVLIVWDIENGSVILDESWNHVIPKVVRGFYKNLIVLGWRKNSKFEVLNIETAQIEYEFGESYKHMSVMDGRIIFLTLDNVIHILTWDDKSLEKFTCCDAGRLSSKLLVKDDHLFSFCRQDTNEVTLCVWNISTKTKLHSTLFTKFHDVYHSFLISKYVKVVKLETSVNSFGNVIELWDYTNNRTLELRDTIRVPEKIKILAKSRRCNSQRIMLSNDNFIIINQRYKVRIWCLRTRCFLYKFDEGILSHNMGMSNAKLTYVAESRASRKVYAKDEFIFCIRDYEI